jgi:hypothetical protein
MLDKWYQSRSSSLCSFHHPTGPNILLSSMFSNILNIFPVMSEAIVQNHRQNNSLLYYIIVTMRAYILLGVLLKLLQKILLISSDIYNFAKLSNCTTHSLSLSTSPLACYALFLIFTLASLIGHYIYIQIFVYFITFICYNILLR